MSSDSANENCLGWSARDPSGTSSPDKFNRGMVRSDDVLLKNKKRDSNVPCGSRFFEWHQAPEGAVDCGGISFLGNGGPSVTVVLLGWLGSKQKHLKRYADMYTSMGINAVTVVVPVTDVLWFDFWKRVEGRISTVSNELLLWLSQPEIDGQERSLLFHTFSNTGWLIYGSVIDYVRGREDLQIEKIKGCIVDSGADAELNPKVWAAGFFAAVWKKRSTATYPAVEADEVNEHESESTSSSTPEKASIIETLLLSLFEKVFSYVLKMPVVNRWLVKSTSLLSTNQPPCPQLYLYSKADRVIPFRSVELFIENQRKIGIKAVSFNFGSSPHVDHYRTFPHAYTSVLHSFLKECLATIK